MTVPLDPLESEARRRWLEPDLLLAAVLLLPLALYPLARDQGVFAYGGSVVLDGGLPYRDLFDTKGPLLFYLYALGEALFGRTVLGLRVFFASIALLGAAFAARLAEHLGGRSARIPTLAAICAAMGSTVSDDLVPWMFGGQAEDFLVVMVLGGILIASEGAGLQSTRRWGALGVLFGASLWIKPVLLPTIAILGLLGVGLLVSERRPPADIARKLGAVAVGGLVPAVLGFLWFWLQGAWDDLLQFQLRHGLQYAGRRVPLSSGVWVMAWSRFHLWLLVFASVFGYFATTPRRPTAWLLLVGAFVGTGLGVVWQGKYFPYHWTPAMLLGVVLLGGWVGRLLARRHVAWVVVAAMLVAVGSSSWTSRYPATLARAGAVVVGAMSLDGFRAPYLTGAVTADELPGVVTAIVSRTTPTDTVVIWGHETLVHFLAQRAAPSRFTIDGPLWVEGSYTEQYRTEYVASLRANPPRLFVVVHDDETPLESVDSATSLARFEALDALVRQQYLPAETVGRFEIWSRRPEGE